MPFAPPLRRALLTALALGAGACSAPGRDAGPSPEDAAGPAPSAAPPAPAPEAPPAPVRKPPPAPDPHLTLDVNLPAGRLDVVRDGEVVKSYPVSVGYLPYPTPVGTFRMRTIIWNPWWHPPESEWAAKRTKTPPGASNPMGRAKLLLDEENLIYIHGTTATTKLGRPASHGCIRMANASVLELAQLIAEHTRALDGATIRRLEKDSQATRELTLPHPISVVIRYDRAEVRDDSLVVHRDVYGRASDAMASARRAWQRAGRDEALLTPEVLALAIRRGSPPAPTAPPSDGARPAPRLLGVPAHAPDAPPDSAVLGSEPAPEAR